MSRQVYQTAHEELAWINDTVLVVIGFLIFHVFLIKSFNLGSCEFSTSSKSDTA